MANAADLFQPLLPGLKPVPALQPGICPVCRTGVRADFIKCYPCRKSSLSVVPISLSIHGELLHHHLRHYKDNPPPLGPGAVFDRVLSVHVGGSVHW